MFDPFLSSDHRWQRRRDPLRHQLVSGVVLVTAAANVVMQLSQPGVGRGVVESRVTSGSLVHHPWKRTRTTLSYVMIALFGSEDERSALAGAVDGQHRYVVSNEDSPLPYDARDPELQLWVGACMYLGALQGYELLQGEASETVRRNILERCGRFATTLQVAPTDWPADLDAFAAYWERAVATTAVDEETRRYLRGLLDLTFTPRWLRRIFGRAHAQLGAGFLGPHFRSLLGLAWSPADERRFGRWCHVLRLVNRCLPRPLREVPWNLFEYDARRRIRRGRPLV